MSLPVIISSVCLISCCFIYSISDTASIPCRPLVAAEAKFTSVLLYISFIFFSDPTLIRALITLFIKN